MSLFNKSFRNLRWYEWAMFAAMVLIGGYYMLTDTTQALIDGTDPWDAETEYVLKTVGDFQTVYSSEPGYDAYFKWAYPWAEHRLVDSPRIHVPVSETMIRGMEAEEAEKWV